MSQEIVMRDVIKDVLYSLLEDWKTQGSFLVFKMHHQVTQNLGKTYSWVEAQFSHLKYS